MEKIKEIDYLRGLLTVFVIIIHITSGYLAYPKDSLTYQVFGSFNCALTFAVPAFLFISAFVMTYQAKHKENVNMLKFTGKRIVKVLSALIIWSVIYVLYSGNFQNITLNSVIKYLILGNASYHLYFLPLIIQLYLLFPIIWVAVKKISKIKINICLGFFICFITATIFQSLFTEIFRLNLFKTFIYFAIVIFSYTLPVTMGIWLGFNYEGIKNFFNKYFMILLIVLTIFACSRYVKFEFITYTYKTTLFFSPLYYTIAILTLVYLLRYIKNGKFLNKISKNSFIIYLIHPLILDIINKLSINSQLKFNVSAFWNYTFNITLKFVIVLMISYLSAALWYKAKNIPYRIIEKFFAKK